MRVDDYVKQSRVKSVERGVATRPAAKTRIRIASRKKKKSERGKS